MTIRYYLTPDKLIDSKSDIKESASSTPAEQGSTQMISYLCHIPGKLSFTVTATSLRQSNAVHISRIP